ncbi:MAG: multiple antibiotic resistance protein [Miltoncostaeaceae bacterium]|jgi:multiple antibiotic resistance protein|nr:multiple antibiotic resistance protein [Miltoncostaeaceae bacterium]
MANRALSTFITFLVILDPLGTVPIFLALSKRLDDAERRRAAAQGVFVALAVIGLVALVGGAITSYLGISLESLTVAGGALLGLVAIDLLRGRFDEPAVERRHIALVPLGTPLLAGPGAIVATILLMQRHRGSGRLDVAVGILGALLVVWVVLRLSVVIARRIPSAWIYLLSRVMGLLLAAVAVDLVLKGLEAWLAARR